MKYDEIRNMSDEELAKYLKSLSNRNCKKCICGKPAEKVIRVENLEWMQTKQLCGLCDSCYHNMLRQLDVYDINWG